MAVSSARETSAVRVVDDWPFGVLATEVVVQIASVDLVGMDLARTLVDIGDHFGQTAAD